MLTEYRTVRFATRTVEAALGREMAETIWRRLPESLRLQPHHFSSELTLAEKRNLFEASVRLVEVETHSFCNRACWFCPNSFIDRRSSNERLPESTYTQILEDLRSIDYRHVLSFSRYNEPFADDTIFDRIEQAHQTLPHCSLRTFSNGDYLTHEAIKRAANLGIRELQLSIYLPDSQRWTKTTAENALRKAVKRLGLVARCRREIPTERIAYRSACCEMQITLFCPNYSQYGVDRGGTVSNVSVAKSPRVTPCLYAATDCYIDYDGSVMPCCHLRNDIESHQCGNLGTVDDNPGSLFIAWASETAARWREILCLFGPKPAPCRGCTAREWSDSTLGRALYQLVTKRCQLMRSP